MGAAISQISGEYRDMVTLSSDLTRDQVVERSIAKATDIAIANGANPSSVKVIEKSVDPVPYVGEGGNVVVVYIKVVGDLQQDCEELPDQSLEKKDNPNWPYENEEVQKLDRQFGLPEPTISKNVELCIKTLHLSNDLHISYKTYSIFPKHVYL